MKEQLVSFEVAKLAKEKGFDWNCRFLYNPKDPSLKGGWKEGTGVDYNWNKFDTFSAPTQSLLQKWLREVHKLEINIQSDMIGYYMFLVNRDKLLRVKVEKNNIFQIYEQALEFGILESLKLIKDDKKI